MTKDEKGVGELFRKFTPRPAPPALRRRMIAAAEASRKEDRFLSPGQGRAAVAFGLFIVVALAGDAFVGRTARVARELLAETWNARPASRMTDPDSIREISGQDRRLEKWIFDRLAANGVPVRARRLGMTGGGVGWRDFGEVDDVI